MASVAGTARDEGTPGRFTGSSRRWQNLWVRLAVALAFADASIVVLALPQIIDRLHTTIVGSTWVIMTYNIALIVGSVAIATVGSRLPSTPTLVGGLAVFGLASLGCGASSNITMLEAFRAVQGLGGAMVVAASLPLFADAKRPGDSALVAWSAAAAIGAAVGPAAGGVLTQFFDWRSIFLAQAPVAAFAAVAVWNVRHHAKAEVSLDVERPTSMLDPWTANVSLGLLSAAIIGALFLVVIELINGWLMTPLAAAGVVTTIPLATALAERAVRGRSAILLGSAGAVMLAVGLVLLALLHHRTLGVVFVALALCGAGIGLAFPGLTSVALESGGTAVARAAKTVAARDLGLMAGLLILTPIFSHQVDLVSKNKAPLQQVVAEVETAPLSIGTKVQLGTRLLHAYNAAGKANVINVDPVFKQVRGNAPASEQPALATMQKSVEDIIQRAVTPGFKRPYQYAVVIALLVLPVLASRLLYVRNRGGGSPPPGGSAGTAAS